MPYFPKFRLLFLHVPKNGGTSVENTLQQIQRLELFDWKKSHERHGRSDKRLQQNNIYGYELINGAEFALQHLTYAQMRKWNYMPAALALSILVVVRNPYSRIVSEYRWRLIFGYDKSFCEFVNEVNVHQLHRTSQHHQHLLPQVEFVKGVDLTSPLVHIVYFEHLAEGMQHFFEEMATEFAEFEDAELRRDNDTVEISEGSRYEKMAKKPWQTFYVGNERARKQVYEIYEEDFKQFGYTADVNAE